MADTEQEDKKKNIPFQPLENIALAFSGGGYRAASFSLGILSYFNHVKYKGDALLKNVRGLSTVSGGTITGALYATSTAENISFEEFYKKLYSFMSDDTLMNDALSILEDDTTWKHTDKKRSLINAFAICYQKKLTGANMGHLKNADLCHMDDVIFNATEFRHGHPFRFIASGSGGMFGNKNLNSSELNTVADDISVADAIAASSCFPMGFEPIIFPEDFMENKGPKFEALKKTPQFRDSVGLMDGGIVDNQGIESIILADKRRRKENNSRDPFGLLMVCDVSSPFMENWVGYEEKEAKGWREITFNTMQTVLPTSPTLRFSGLGLTLVGIFILLIAKVWPNISIANYGDMHLLSGILLTLGLVLLLFKYLGKLLAWAVKRFVVAKLMDTLPWFIRRQLHHFGGLRFALLETMLKNRVSSVIQMVSEVFMKRVRTLTYYQVYTNDDWKYRRSSCMIYDLTDKGIEWRRQKVGRLNKYHTESMKDPGSKIKNTAYIAYQMATTLWFEEEDRRKRRLESLVACGQFTVCFSLMLYLRELNEAEESPHKGCLEQSELKAVYDSLEKDWEKFKKDPFWLMSAMS